MSLQNLSKSAVRVGKNYLKGYTDTQIKVRDATSNDPWGPSGTQMAELAQLSHNPTDFIEMMEILDKRLNDKGKNWRHVFKALSVLDYLLHSGSESVWNYFHDNIYIVKTLKEFQYIDDASVDQGINVRQKAKDITALLLDEAKMRQRRRHRYDIENSNRDPDDFSDEAGRRRRQQQQSRQTAEDRELEQALEESRRMAAEEDERRRRNAQQDADMERALALSREEEEKRKKKDNLINLDQESEPTYGALQPQYTSFLPVQATGFNPFFQAQMQQQEMLQQQYLQQQEYQRQMALQQAAQQYQYMMTQQPQPLMPQPTNFGSNNPWLQASTASSTPAPAPQPAPQPAPEPTDTLINLDGPEEPAPAPKPSGPPRVKLSEKHAELDRLLASGDGVDTFGNTGDMRLGHSAMRLNPMLQQRTGQAAALGQTAFDSPKPASNPFAM
ncbi:hypothetical protein MEQU1_000937 [Malassezia equina]|uniref:ENTH domain-containing protein n=1 Tax=Malassezia equina TaxID=1381935 RepID=A0AAF0ECR4_9BASI|nr:hypothetical protein MEQU1_000937 [Malassezia equina]